MGYRGIVSQECAMKSCPACNAADLPDKARFCPTCGAALPAEPAPPPPPRGLEVMAPATTPRKKSKFSETLWFKEGEDAPEEEAAASFDTGPIQDEKYERKGKTPEEVRRRFSLNPDGTPTDDDILP